ncbi:MAG: SRPBCC family protein [Bacteroidota bacterium]
MSKMHIERSINISAPSQNIYKVISDFNDWQPWSPWLLMEPGVKVTVAEDSKSYKWEGNRTGSGNMKIIEERENEFINYDLNFLKPWKSTAKTNFKLSEEGDATKVTWTMDSSLPFFMFFMKGMMEAYVGADYERGLDMLKAYVEEGVVPSKLEFEGTKDFGGGSWLGIKTDCSIDDIGPIMEADFAKISAFIEEKGLTDDLQIATIYHKWDIPKNKVSYSAILIAKEIPAGLPKNFVKGSIPPTKCYVLKHVGKYQHLGNAWSTLYTMMRNKEIKHNKKVDPFELYVNDPQQTAENELITDLYFPVK